MLNEQEQLEIRLISDNDLYQQALEFMNRMGGLLSQTQINGLLNVSLANTYDRFDVFIKRQGARKTWPQRERHVEHFYKTTLPAQLAQMAKTCVPAVLKHRQEAASREDVQAIKMALAREFLQHLLAENSYRNALGQAGTGGENGQRTQGRPDQRPQVRPDYGPQRKADQKPQEKPFEKTQGRPEQKPQGRSEGKREKKQ